MTFTTPQWEKHHWQKFHSDESINKCDLCDKTFEDKNFLLLHIEINECTNFD